MSSLAILLPTLSVTAWESSSGDRKEKWIVIFVSLIRLWDWIVRRGIVIFINFLIYLSISFIFSIVFEFSLSIFFFFFLHSSQWTNSESYYSPFKTCSITLVRTFADVEQEYWPESAVVRFLIMRCETMPATLCSVIMKTPPPRE